MGGRGRGTLPSVTDLSAADDVSPLMRVLREHFVLVLATADRDGPWAAPLYYAVAEGDGDAGPADAPRLELLFLTDPQTLHGRHLVASARAAAAIHREAEGAPTRGLQLRGTVRCCEGGPGTPRGTDRDAAAWSRYLERHPVTHRHLQPHGPHRLWALRVEEAKLTDVAALGFGVHRTWQLA
jgi:uncharacterized protein YhbP (UPF0306 family)